MSQTVGAITPVPVPMTTSVTGIPKQKVIAAAGGSGVATALALILLYALQSAGVSLPDNIRDAVTTVIVAVLTFLAGYVCPPGASEGSTRDSTGAVKSAIVRPV